jgi:hypothetical protein
VFGAPISFLSPYYQKFVRHKPAINVYPTFCDIYILYTGDFWPLVAIAHDIRVYRL